jgi:ribose/xylose/arabinose/galactoside ABC-type transport system permease subunit
VKLSMLTKTSENAKASALRLAVLIAVIGLFAFLNPAFVSSASLLSVLQGLVFVGIAAVFLTILITSGEFDISIGANAALSGTLAALFVVAGEGIEDDRSPWLGLLVATLVGLAIGLINALVVLVGNVPSFIATIAMLFIAKSLATFIPGGKPVPNYRASWEAEGIVFRDSFFLTNFSIIVFVVMIVVGHIILKRTHFGVVAASIGSNQEAARTSGAPVKGIKTLLFALTGAGAGLAGGVSVLHFGSIYFALGAGWELTAIAAIVLGGTSLFGGKGSIFGLLFGLALMQSIASGMVAVGIDPWWQTVITGGIVLAVLVAEQLRKKVGWRNDS